MKKILMIAAMSAVLITFSSCGNEDEPQGFTGKTADLRIETEIAGMVETYSTTNAFAEGSKLSLWVTPGTLGTNYNLGPYNNVLAELKSGKWQLTPQVKLSDTPAVMYAFFPYGTSYTNGKDNMNVYHTNQVDYMFGTNAEGYNSVDRNNPNVKIRMKHVKALLQFRIKKMNYPGEGKLTKVEVLNNNGKYEIRSGAALNIASGELSFHGNQHSPALLEDINGLVTITDEAPTLEKDYVNLMLLPVTNTTAQSSVLIKFIIDDNTFYYGVPVNTSWKQGTKYIYNVTLNGTELTIDDVIITDWTTGPENSINLF